MKARDDRPWRKDGTWFWRTASGRPAWRARLVVAMLAAIASATFALPAAAVTGGAKVHRDSAFGSSQGLVFGSVRSARATWYGPGFYGRRTACGQMLRPQTVGVAHRRLPCGTAVRFMYRGERVIAPVIDRGPYAKGRTWDLTNGARQALRFSGSGQVRYAIAVRGKQR